MHYFSKLRICWRLFPVFPLVCAACISPSDARALPNAQESDTGVRLAGEPPEQLAQNRQGDRHQEPLVQLQPIPPSVPPESNPPVESEPEPVFPTSAPDSTGIQVEKIVVTGNTIFDAQINSIVQPLEGQTVTAEKLQKAADQITELYLNQGFLTSRAVLDQKSLATGAIAIQVIEGELEEIEIEGTQRLNPGYIRSRVELGAGQPLNIANLEGQLRLLRNNPLFESVEATLRAGTEVGKSILVVRVSEAGNLDASLGADNYSPPSIGSERLILNLLARNLSGIGDQISASYRPRAEAIGDSYRVEFRYLAPLNPMDGTLELRTLLDRNEVVQGDFQEFDIRGRSERYNISYRQPLIRTPREELALSLGFTYREGQTFTFAGPTPFGFGPNEDGVSRTSVFQFGQDYTLRDVSGAWAFRSQFRLGTGLFDATNNPSPIPDSKFFSWLAQVQRVQVLNDHNFLIIQGDLQLATDGLLPSEQFVIGGGQSVRGYRQNVRAGDNGFRFSIEDRIILVRDQGGQPVFILAPFFDMGSVWNVGDNPNPQFSQRFVAALGLGLLWQPIEGLNIRLDYAPPLIDLDDRGNNVQDDGFYFSVRANF